MTDRELLEQEIDRAGVKTIKLMKAAGIKSYATFRGRIEGKTEFTVGEIKAISDVLQLTAAQRDRIFFATNV